jgi:hypothetical protein
LIAGQGKFTIFEEGSHCIGFKQVPLLSKVLAALLRLFNLYCLKNLIGIGDDLKATLLLGIGWFERLLLRVY